MRKLSLIVLLTTLIISVSAQNHIRGKITDENNRPLAGATVLLKQTGQTEKTNRQGEFAFNYLT
ncbi:MAG: carboxypeptidase-like regulatory domain-containing protein, partial [Paludibacteraceae bacterium]